MIDSARLLTDLQGLIRKLEADLRERSESAEVPEVGAILRAEYREASQGKRTAATYPEWLEERITQMAIAWTLSAVFGRFLEDNGLVEPPMISGMGKRLQRARDEHELYFRAYPKETDRDYLLAVFGEWERLPVAGEIFGAENPIQGLPYWLSGDGAGEILKFFQRVDSETGGLVHDFTDPSWDSRFLGDLYQDLSEGVRKKYALLQTPIFVEEFILERTLEPALEEFGLFSPSLISAETEPAPGALFRLIDPACGSGHFLLGAFRRILRRWQSQAPGTNERVLAQRALDSVYGVDLNPYAASIARFRLLLAALMECGITKLREAPAFRINVVCGDSLLHGAGSLMELTAYYSRFENAQRLQEFLRPHSFHAVVANPPYITPKDQALNQVYRDRYSACHMKYSLAIPFMERIFELAVEGGYTGQITANSFMKREFGKRLIEDFFKGVDLQTVIDTSGAYIPGHGTPTVILFGRKRKPVSSTVRAVMGIRGEPTTPANPAEGLVWTAILNQVDIAGSESEFVSVADVDRQVFHKHPWSLGGGGASDLREWLDKNTNLKLGNIANAIGITSVTGEDDLFIQSLASIRRLCIENTRFLVEGDVIRDWLINSPSASIWLYDYSLNLLLLEKLHNTYKVFWKYRVSISKRKRFGTPMVEKGLKWYEWQELYKDKLYTSLSIVFAFIASHNHFVLDRGGKVFKQSAPVIKLAKEATEDDHLALLGLLNSSTACFWMNQVTQIKTQTTGMDSNSWQLRREFDGTKLQQFPIPAAYPLDLAQKLDRLAQQLTQLSPQNLINNLPAFNEAKEYQDFFNQAWQEWQNILGTLIFLQEELDWHCYFLYGLIKEELTDPNDPFPLQLGQRPFEIVLARQIANGETESAWFKRHNSQPITEIPEHWPQTYQTLVQKRLETIQTHKNITLIEKPEYKRRWNTEPWETQLQNALQTWLLDRLESYFDFDGRMNRDNTPKVPLTKGDLGGLIDISLISAAKLADVAQQDPQFMAVAELYTGDPAFKIQALINQLVENESVPLLPVLRYKPSGLRKRQDWENTWHLQRLEDQIDARGQLPKDHPQYLDIRQIEEEKKRQIGAIPVPPKYTSADFLKSHYWRLRGKLDVPKERWISFPHCQKADGQPLIAWAGYNPLQLAQAISADYIEIQEKEGGQQDPRLIPLLAGLLELLPWLQQWHNDIDPQFGVALGDYFQQFIQEEAKQRGLTLEQIRQWQPPQTSKRRR